MSKIEEFWLAFSRNEQAIARLTTADDPLYDAVLVHLQEVAPGLYFEFSSSADHNELIITADGNSSLFETVDQIVAQAPEIKGWRILSLKPKIGFPNTTRWEGISVTIADVRFRPIRRKDSDLVDLELFVPNVDEDSRDAVHNALLRAIDHGLGERRFSETIAGTTVRIASWDAAGCESYPLTYLDEYISRLKQRV